MPTENHDNADMPITGRRAELQLFVDRHRYVREFLTALHRRPPESQLLFFYGVGGVGKSLLLRYLRDRGCTLLSPAVFTALDELGDDEFRTAFENAVGDQVPVALHDFSAHVVGDEDPCNDFHGPLMLRATLGRMGFRFPRFDFAVVLFAQRKGFSSEKIAALLPATDKGVTGDLLSFLIDNSKVGAVASYATTKLFERYGEGVSLTLAKRRAPESQIAEIYGLEMDTELVPLLPRYLAEDLTEALDKRAAQGELARLCLFFDTHDAFWAEQHFGGPEAQRNSRDQWFRTLVNELDLARTLVVVTGRERPRWSSAATQPVAAERVRDIAVGDLAPEDADLYLRQRGVAAATTRAVILQGLETETGLHPLSLGLAADLVNVKGDGSADDLAGLLAGGSLDFSRIGPKLLERLLSYLPTEECQAITALGACRTFDRDLYLMLGKELAFTATGAAFRELKRLSFVIPYVDSSGQESFKVHTLLRKSLIESTDELVQETHDVLTRHYGALSREVGDPAHVEQLFHSSRLAGRRDAAVREWLESIALAADATDTPMLLRLLGLEDELELRTWQERGMLALGQQALHGTQGRSDDARAVLSEALEGARAATGGTLADQLLRAELLLQLGWVERYRTRAEAATAAFEEALAVLEGTSPACQHMRGRLWFGLSGVPSDAGERDAAASMLVEAAAGYQRGLAAQDSPTPMRWISDASFTDTCLATSRRVQGRLTEAIALAERAVVLARQAHELATEDLRGLMNLESAYAELATCLAADDLPRALELADLAVAVSRQRATRSYAPAGHASLVIRSRLWVRAGDADSAGRDLAEATSLARRASELQPRNRGSQLNLAEVLLEGASGLQPWERAAVLSEATAAATRALAIAPGWRHAQTVLDAIARRAAGSLESADAAL